MSIVRVAKCDGCGDERRTLALPPNWIHVVDEAKTERHFCPKCYGGSINHAEPTTRLGAVCGDYWSPTLAATIVQMQAMEAAGRAAEEAIAVAPEEGSREP